MNKGRLGYRLSEEHTANTLKHTEAFTRYIINALQLQELTINDLDQFRTMLLILATISKNVKGDLKSRESSKLLQIK